MARLFCGVFPPAEIQAELASLPLPAGRLVRPVLPDNIHLTLTFVGELFNGKTADMADRLANVSVASFVLPTGKVGVFPPRGPARVLWAGVGSGHPHLFQLKRQIDDILLQAGLHLEEKHFHPHFTLARAAQGLDHSSLRPFLAQREWEGPPFRVLRFGLYESLLTPIGARYQPYREYALQEAGKSQPLLD